jgi:hypothetical protein
VQREREYYKNIINKNNKFMKENINQNPKEYRKDLSKVLKDVRKVDSESAEFLRDKEKEKPHHQKAEELVRSQHKLEKELGEFKSGTFNTHNVEEKIDDKELEKIKELGYNVEKEVFVSLNEGCMETEGFELLKAIEGELTKSKTKNLKIFVVNEIDSRNRAKKTGLPIPFRGMPIESSKKNEPTISQILEDSKRDDAENYISKTYGDSIHSDNGFSGQSYVRDVMALKENQCKLVEEWAEFLSKSFEKSGFHRDEYNTYSSGNDMTLSHSNPVSDSKKFEALFNEFLKQKNVELIKTSTNLGEYNKAIPVATEAYNILVNTDASKYGYPRDHWRQGWEKKQKEGRKDSYGEQIAIELMARPKSIFDKNYAFGQEKLKTLER